MQKRSAQFETVQPVLMSSDISASVSFYERLGFRVSFRDDPRDPKYVAIQRDGVELHLQWHQKTKPEGGDRPTYRFPVMDVDGLYAELLERGAIAAQPAVDSPWLKPVDTPWHTREFHVRDPDGNGLQFYHPL
jgi:catechol 2,3-dioxygenase-like lactoylglutathione lyase family enzyme